MIDPTANSVPGPQETPTLPAATPAPAQTGPTIHISDEFGNAKRNLPPAKVLLLAMGGVLVIAAIVSFLQRAKPQAVGSLDNVIVVEIPGHSAVMTALTFTLHNSAAKPLWVHNIEGKVVTPGEELTSEAVSPMDFDRYYQAFPALKAGSQAPLTPEDKLQPGQELKRTVIISFPATLESFNQRKSVSVVIHPYDQPLPVVLTQQSVASSR
jgi:hypothetical protein